ncbi:MAG TPA: class II fructose-bisphosphate aldolase [Thermoanaerobaculia bacterium]|jgi:fructose/tagatose bisphosphate aldolase|nr:class II fructose-bisphosphate aldolase [Thermoanaerobaculia bacterium]
MNLYSNAAELEEDLDRSGTVRREGLLVVTDPSRFREEMIDGLVWTAVFGIRDAKEAARRSIREAAASLGILPASILPLYAARGRGEISGFTVPAINVRMLAYDTARAACRAARKLDAGAVVFEIARSEIGYTDQRPGEYAVVILAAAIRESWVGPVFVQGDHFQTNPKRMEADPDREIAAIEALIEEAIAATFYQIDIDTSTLVDLSKPTLEEQQAVNSRLTARFTKFIRAREPKDMPISVGGEIGEVGKSNSTPDELRAYMDVYLRELGGAKGISKVSVQTGSSHGGVVGPDGTVLRVQIDFETLRRISKVAREEYGLAGAVQHGASTLPAEFFGSFPEYDCAEIHLATEFQNIVYDHPVLPAPLKREVERWLFEKFANQKKKVETDSQFLYKNRKQAIGPFKEQFWNLPAGTREAIRETLEKKFAFLFEKLAVARTRDLVARYVKPVAELAGVAGPRAGYVRDDEAGD